MKKKKRKKLVLPKKDLVLEEHIVKLIEEAENKKAIKKTIEAVVSTKPKKKAKKESSKEEKENKTKKTKQSPYGHRRFDREYRNLEDASIYSQVIINPFVGFVYKSNVKDSKETYAHLMHSEIAEKTPNALGEKNLASHKMMDDYALKVTLNFLTGISPLFGIGGDVSIEEKDQMKFNLYDRAQNVIYQAKVAILGFGYSNTCLKTMHAPMHEKAA